MPQLPSQQFKHKSPSGESMEFESRVAVSSSGEFSFTLPTELEETAAAMKDRQAPEFAGVSIGWGRSHFRLTTKQLDLGPRAIKALLSEHLACEVVERDVIAYRYRSGVHYFKTTAGVIAPCGYDCGQLSGEWKGKKERFSNELSDLYSLEFVAFALVETTYRRKLSEKLVYRCWKHPVSHFDLADPRARLNAFVRLNPPVGSADESGIGAFTVIPYTPEAAEFFYRTMISFCRIDDQLSSFFSDNAAVQKAIASGQMPLLGGPASA